MVKVKKPIAQTVTNNENLGKAIKKKKDIKPKKSLVDAVVAPLVQMKKKSLQESKTVTKVEPVKSTKFEKKKNQSITEKAVKKNNKEVNGEATKKTNRPLVLAPLEPPTPPRKLDVKEIKVGDKKVKNNNKKPDVVAVNKKVKNVNAKPNAQSGEKTTLTKTEQKKANKRAFKKKQVKNKREGREKKPKPPRTQVFEQLAYDEDNFNAIVNVPNVKKIIKALQTTVEKQVTEKKKSIFSDYRYWLDVVNFKIPNCPKRMVKLNLEHSLIDKDDDVVIIVPDIQRGAKVDYEPTIQYYEDVFREAGVGIKLKIMPFNQLRNECNTFESVRKFRNTYDYFLCDGRVAGQVVGFCGKIFQKPCPTFHSIRLQRTKNLKADIEKSLKRTAFRQLAKGNVISIPVGSHRHTVQQVAENIDIVVTQLKTIFPGGIANVRSMHLKIDIVGTSSLPIYISMAQPPAEAPFVLGPREERMLKLKKEANEVLTKFSLTKEADIKKLTKDKVERKRKYKEGLASLNSEIVNGAADSDSNDEVPTIPKKVRKEERVVTEKNLTQKLAKEKPAEIEKEALKGKPAKITNQKLIKKQIAAEIESEEEISEDDEDDDVDEDELDSD